MTKRRRKSSNSPAQIEARTRNFDIFRLKGMIKSVRKVHENAVGLISFGQYSDELKDIIKVHKLLRKMIVRRKNK